MELRKIAFDMDQDNTGTNTGTAKRQSHAKDYKKLGFQVNDMIICIHIIF